MGFEFVEFSAKVAREPAAAAEELRRLFVEEKLTAEQVGERLGGVKRRTVVRWISRLRDALGEEGLGFRPREGRRPGVEQARKKRRRSKRSSKKRTPPKKVIAN